MAPRHAYAKPSKHAWSMHDDEEEEPEQVEEAQDSKADASSESGTQTIISQKRQKYEIYLKLMGMLFLPLALLIVLAVLVMKDYTDTQADRKTVTILAVYLRKLNAYTGRCQIERGTSAVYMSSGGSNSAVLTERRGITDTMGQDLVDYLDSVKETLPRSFLKAASGCRHFFLHDIAQIRQVVDSFDRKALGQYTAGIDKCHLLVARFPEYMANGPKSGSVIAISTLLAAKELSGICRAVVSSALVAGSVTQANIVYQDTAQLRVNSLLDAFMTSVGPDERQEVANLLASDVGLAWKAITEEVLNLVPGVDTFEGLTKSNEYFATYSAFISGLSGLISNNIDRIEQLDEQTTYTIWLTCILITAGLTPFIAIWAGRAISVPFTRLETIKRKLKAEKTKHTLHNEAVTRFVPFESLELLGCTDIVEVEVGTNQIRRMTIMFSYLHNFNILASRLGADHIVTYLNQWLDGILPHIQRNRGLVDKFMGDGILAFFYKPEESIIAGAKMAEWLVGRNKEAAASGSMALEFGVGINSGDVCIGTIGSDTRMTTTAIGDEVNVAARIQSCTKMYGTRLLISESSKNFANSNNYSFRYMGQTTVKGRVEPVDIYENLDCLEPAELALKKQTNIQFQAALKTVTSDPDQAVKSFREVLELNPNDAAAQWYIRNITEGPQEFIK